MAEVNDRVSDSISHHRTREAIECMFNNPRILFRSIYSNSELELESEELGNYQDNDCCVEKRSSDKHTDSSSEVERSLTKKLRLSKSPKKLANCNGHPSSSCPGRLLPFVSKSTSAEKKTLVCAKANQSQVVTHLQHFHLKSAIQKRNSQYMEVWISLLKMLV